MQNMSIRSILSIRRRRLRILTKSEWIGTGQMKSITAILIFLEFVFTTNVSFAETLTLVPPKKGSKSFSKCTGRYKRIHTSITKSDQDSHIRSIIVTGKSRTTSLVQTRLPWQAFSSTSIKSVNEKAHTREYKLTKSDFPKGNGPFQIGKKYSAVLTSSGEDSRSPISVSIIIGPKRSVTNSAISPDPIDVYEVTEERKFAKPNFLAKQIITFHPETNSILKGVLYHDGSEVGRCTIDKVSK